MYICFIYVHICIFMFIRICVLCLCSEKNVLVYMDLLRDIYIYNIYIYIIRVYNIHIYKFIYINIYI